MSITVPPGVFDIVPYDEKEMWRSSFLWDQVETLIRKTARDYGYQEIRTPLFERTELFQRGVGDTSDIVSKEMYTFLDKGNRSLSLRPEGTAPVMRAFIEHQMHQDAPIHKFFYIASMFRYERSQAGRYRQHHQFGAEAIGNGSPEQDVEIIDLLFTFYQRLGLKNLQLSLNSIGDVPCRLAYRKALQDYLRSSFDKLSEDSKARFETNPLRILDSKDPNDRVILTNAPSILDFLKSECMDHFQAVQKLLNELKIPYVVSPHLVRGLDYYNKTVFEFIAGELGAQNSIGGGGRYDGLLKQLGGPDLPAMGFGAGIERIIQTLLKQNAPIQPPQRPVLFLIALGDEAKAASFVLLHHLRQTGIPTYMDFSGRKLGKVMQHANQMQAKFVAVIGENELKSNEIDLKNMSSGEAMKVSLDSLMHILQIDLKSDDFIQTWLEMARPFKNPKEAQFLRKKINDSIAETSHITEEFQGVIRKIKDVLEEQ